MTYSANTVIPTIKKFIHDPDETIWSVGDLCKHVTEAQHLIASLRPDATATMVSHTVSMSPKQTLPVNGVRLLDVPMNTDGAPIRKTTREILTETIPAWTTETGTEVEFFAFDPENPRVFWVHPKPSLPFAIELIYSKLPEQFTEESTCLSVSDIYITSLYEWVMYRCYSMEGKGMDMGEASIHLNNFYNIMGIKKQNEILLQQVQENT